MPRAAFTGNVREFWTPARVRIFCLTVLALLIFHIAWVFLSDTQHTSLLKRGDFPSFYSAAMIVRQGLADRLYDTATLRYVQNLYWPSLRGGYISFPYPPYVAAALLPLAYVPPLAAKFLVTLFMTACLAGSAAFASAFAPVFKNKLQTAAFFLAFFPISFSVLGGQNGALSMLCCSAILYFISRGDGAHIGKNEIAAGVWLGIWMFKPQYGAVLFLFFALAGLWRTVLAAGAVMLLEYLAAAKVGGWLWPGTWISAVSRDAALDFPYNSFNMVSISGFFYSAGKWLHAGAGVQAVLNISSVLLSLATLLLLARKFWELRRTRHCEKRSDEALAPQSPALNKIPLNVPSSRRDEAIAVSVNKEMRSPRRSFGAPRDDKAIFNLLLISAPVLLLISPHALFYDTGLCVIAGAAFFDGEQDRSIWNLILITLFASLSAAFKSYLPVQPLIFFVFGSLLFMVRKIKKNQ